ncbi:MAG: hypothetical protein HC904_17260 [Blastochloris sp.]|nr:hypothetical protein [Blastochloris sp.]
MVEIGFCISFSHRLSYRLVVSGVDESTGSFLAMANPFGEQVVAGSADFDRVGSTPTANQTTDKSI